MAARGFLRAVANTHMRNISRAAMREAAIGRGRAALVDREGGTAKTRIGTTIGIDASGFLDRLDDFQQDLYEDAQSVVARQANSFQRYARRATRIKTGRLRSSLRVKLDKAALTSQVYYSLKRAFYARFIELGTRRFGGVTGKGDQVLRRTANRLRIGFYSMTTAMVRRAARRRGVRVRGHN